MFGVLIRTCALCLSSVCWFCSFLRVFIGIAFDLVSFHQTGSIPTFVVLFERFNRIKVFFFVFFLVTLVVFQCSGLSTTFGNRNWRGKVQLRFDCQGNSSRRVRGACRVVFLFARTLRQQRKQKNLEKRKSKRPAAVRSFCAEPEISAKEKTLCAIDTQKWLQIDENETGLQQANLHSNWPSFRS